MSQVGHTEREENGDDDTMRRAKRQKTLSKVYVSLVSLLVHVIDEFCSCENCRQKKAKCDSTQPQCEPCRRKGASTCCASVLELDLMSNIQGSNVFIAKSNNLAFAQDREPP
jgi:hypothetical protein